MTVEDLIAIVLAEVEVDVAPGAAERLADLLLCPHCGQLIVTGGDDDDAG